MENVLRSINQAALQLLAPLTTDEIYATIVREAIHLAKAEYGSIFLEQNGLFERVYASSPQLYEVKPRKKAFIYKAFNSREAFVINKQIQELHPQLKRIGIQSVIYIPLAYKNQATGVLTVYSKQAGNFTSKEFAVLKLFGSMATLAIKKAQLYDQTKQALETRDLFISMAAHELRTPLTTINGYVQLLRSRTKTTNSAESKWIEKLDWETYRLSQLVNELLTANRIRTGRLQYIWKECKITEILERATTEFSFAYPDRILRFQNSLEGKDDTVIGDFDKLLQVTTNLLDNAAKFSPLDKEITLILAEKSPYITITIKDKGKGIAEKDLPKIFTGYYKAKGNTEEGMGIGLYLSQHIIHEHKGIIKIKTKFHKGTIVEIFLPKAKVQRG